MCTFQLHLSLHLVVHVVSLLVVLLHNKLNVISIQYLGRPVVKCVRKVRYLSVNR